MNPINRILILGSIASGKTMLARQWAKSLSLPVIHVDSLEFNVDLSKKSRDVVRAEIIQATSQAKWILDGHGPLDLLPTHMKLADKIVFLDFPLYINLFWLFKRQIKIVFKPRTEMPKGANEWQWSHVRKLVTTLFKQHKLMNPELSRILERADNRGKVVRITSGESWRRAFAATNVSLL